MLLSTYEGIILTQKIKDLCITIDKPFFFINIPKGLFNAFLKDRIN